jgi:hypothetical protein
MEWLKQQISELYHRQSPLKPWPQTFVDYATMISSLFDFSEAPGLGTVTAEALDSFFC